MRRSWFLVGLFFVLFIFVSKVHALVIDVNKAFELALERNPKIKQALAAVEAAKAKLVQAESILYPTLDLQLSKTERSKTSSGGISSFPSELNPTPEDVFLYSFMQGVLGRLSSSSGGDYQTKISLSYPIYLGGKKDATIRAAKEDLLTELENLRQVKNEVFYSVAEAYYSLLKAKSAYSIALDSRNLLKAHLEEVKARFDVGMATRSELLRAETALAEADLEVIRAENAVRTAELDLKFAIGLEREEKIEVREELKIAPLDKDLQGYLEEAYSKRPELLSALHGVEALKANEKAVLADYKPQLYLSGTYQWSGDTFPPENDSWSLSLIASFNIFDGGEKKGKLKEVRANLNKVMAAIENLKKSIALQVETAYLAVKEAEERIKVAKAYVDKALEDFKIAEEEYKAGVGTNLDVLDAQNSWRQMRSNYIQALYDANVAIAKLILAVGRDRF
ncbi:MAG: TolC family protein [Synergistetes bacterium]|nr:MAG: Outer membrane efflux protein [bacterium 42_11]MBC7331342.1 TolC family protein [Synergistota bacterium]MDK2871388.1 outer membrane protein [bacterium]